MIIVKIHKEVLEIQKHRNKNIINNKAKHFGPEGMFDFWIFYRFLYTVTNFIVTNFYIVKEFIWPHNASRMCSVQQQ